MTRKKQANPKALQAANRARFLRAYAECGTVTEACRRARVSRQTHFRWVSEDPAFKAQFEDAKNEACDRLVEEARRRAHEGWEEPIVYQGEIQYQVDAEGNRTDKPCTVRKFDSTLLMFLIKGLRPEMYRENYKIDVNANVSAEVRNPQLAALTTEQLQTIQKWYQANGGNGREHTGSFEP